MDEEQQYQPQPVMAGGIGTEVYLYRLESEDLLVNMEHQLRGERKVIMMKDGKRIEVWKKKNKPWLNDEGISQIMAVLSGTGINKNIYLGNINKAEIYTRCRDIWKALASMLWIGYIKFNVPRESRDVLVKMIVYQIHSALSRSEGGRESSQISSTTNRIEHSMQNQQQQQQGMSLGRWMSRHER